MAHNPYHFSWNTTPSGNTPPASTQSPEQFLSDFANVTVRDLSDEDRIFLPNAGQMQQNIAMSRFGLDNAMAAQRLSGTNNLMNMTAGMGINSMGQGFGSRQNMFNSALQNANMQNQQATVQNIADYRSDVLGEQYRYQDALTTALGNLIRSDESEVTVVPNDEGSSGTSGTNNYHTDLNVGDPFPEGAFIPSGYSGNVPEINTIHTDDNNIQYRWTGTTWVIVLGGF